MRTGSAARFARGLAAARRDGAPALRRCPTWRAAPPPRNYAPPCSCVLIEPPTRRPAPSPPPSPTPPSPNPSPPSMAASRGGRGWGGGGLRNTHHVRAGGGSVAGGGSRVPLKLVTSRGCGTPPLRTGPSGPCAPLWGALPRVGALPLQPRRRRPARFARRRPRREWGFPPTPPPGGRGPSPRTPLPFPHAYPLTRLPPPGRRHRLATNVCLLVISAAGLN